MSTEAITLEILAQRIDTVLAQISAPLPRFFSVKHAAVYIDSSEDSIRGLIAANKLTPLRAIRGKILLDKNELDALILGSDQRPRKGRGIRA
jgi:hypothetical protein